MNVETADRMKDCIAFLTARYKDDEEAALAVMGINPDPGYIPTRAEQVAATDQAMSLILGLADFVIAETKLLAVMLNISPDDIMERMAMTFTLFTDGYYGDR